MRRGGTEKEDGEELSAVRGAGDVEKERRGGVRGSTRRGWLVSIEREKGKEGEDILAGDERLDEGRDGGGRSTTGTDNLVDELGARVLGGELGGELHDLGAEGESVAVDEAGRRGKISNSEWRRMGQGGKRTVRAR